MKPQSRHNLLMWLTLFGLTTLFLIGRSNGAKILSISFLSTPSHKIVYEPLLHKLAERGHEVTIVSPIKSKVQLKNVRNIETIAPEVFEKEMQLPNLFEMKESKLMKLLGGFFTPFLVFGGFMSTMCRRNYELPVIQELINGKEKFDAIIFSNIFNDCLYGLIYKLDAPVILISQVSVLPWVSASFGSPSPPSFVPSAFFGFTDQMTFGERLTNFVGLSINEFAKSYLFNPQMEKVYRELIDPNLPGVKEIEANSSIVLCNSHISFTPPKPLMPDIIEVGGMHLKPANPVQPKELDDFLSGSGTDGFILFSMGSALKAHTMPEKYRKIFLNAFAKLRQRVLWKWETEEMEDLPPNVKLSKWLPQTDVLGHKNIKLFITHGGHGGTTEAIFHGVPLVGIPMFGDQQYNMKLAVKKGFALRLEFTELTEEILTAAIQEVLNEPSYRETAKKLSAIYRDHPVHPMDRAVYAVEYVIRHQGARHLRSAGRDLSFWQYYSLDVMATLLAALLFTLYVDFLIVRALYRKCCGRKTEKSENGRQQQKKLIKKMQ